MQQNAQQDEHSSEQPAWEAPELIKADVSTATQINPTGGSDGGVAGS